MASECCAIAVNHVNIEDLELQDSKSLNEIDINQNYDQPNTDSDNKLNLYSSKW